MEPLKGPAAPRWILALLVAVLAAMPFVVTVINFASALQPGGVNALFLRVVGKAVSFTAAQAALSSLLSCAAGLGLGTGLAFWPGRPGARLTRLCESAGLIFFVLPGVTVSLLVLDLHFTLGRVPADGVWAVALAHLILNGLFVAASVARRARAWLAGGGIEQIEAAALCGARGRALWGVSLARLWRAELRVWAPLVFLWSFSAFATVLMLGGGPSRVSLEVLLFFSLQNEADTGRLLTLIGLQAVLGSVVAWVSARHSASGRALAQGARDWDARRLRWLPGARVWRAMTSLGLALLLSPLMWLLSHPLAQVLARGSSAEWVELAPAFGHSLVLASLATGFSLGLAGLLCLADSAARRALFGLSGLSTTLLGAAWSGVGADLWFEGHPAWQLALAGLALAFVQVPLSAHWIENRLSSIPDELWEAAALLGAGPWARARWIARPLLRDVLAKVALLSFVGALGELAFAGLFLGDVEVAAVAARRLASRYDFAAASMVLLFMLVCTLTGVALDIAWRRSEEGVRSHG